MSNFFLKKKTVSHLNEFVDQEAKFFNTNIQSNRSTPAHTSDEAIELGSNLVKATGDSAVVATLNSSLCENIQLRRHNTIKNNILTNVTSDAINVLFAGIVKVGNRRRARPSLDRKGKLRHISSKDIAGRDEGSTIDGNCRGQSREYKNTNERDGREENHFLFLEKKICGLMSGV